MEDLKELCVEANVIAGLWTALVGVLWTPTLFHCLHMPLVWVAEIMEACLCSGFPSHFLGVLCPLQQSPHCNLTL